jgi:phosphonoacetaldehyde hydrolase
MDFVFRRRYRGPIKAVVMDWSGTTIDYGSCAPAMAFVQLFGQHGVPISMAEAHGPMGMHKKDHLRALTQVEAVAQRWERVHGQKATEADVEAMYAGFQLLLLDLLASYATPIPGVLEAVSAFRQRGCKIGSCTAYTREIMDVLVPAAHKLGYKPDSVICVNDVPAGRPEPWMALCSAMELRVYPMEAVVKIGDTLPDIAEGLNAGMWTVGVAMTGSGLGLNQAEIEALSPQELRGRLLPVCDQMYAAGAHYVVDAVRNVPPLLDEIHARLASGEHPIGG